MGHGADPISPTSAIASSGTGTGTGTGTGNMSASLGTASVDNWNAHVTQKNAGALLLTARKKQHLNRLHGLARTNSFSGLNTEIVDKHQATATANPSYQKIVMEKQPQQQQPHNLTHCHHDNQPQAFQQQPLQQPLQQLLQQPLQQPFQQRFECASDVESNCSFDFRSTSPD